MDHPTADIHRQAARLLESAGIVREPVSLRDVVSALNLELVQKTRDPFTSEAALEPLGDTHAIVVNGGSDDRRRRFTIAHEIGHFVLHPGLQRAERGGRVNEAGRIREREADAFAADLLMPEPLVRQAVLEHGADASRLADRFEVSRQAMQTRLQRLDLAGRHAETSRGRP
jgi:Zn-dependent peptidase ImmA (M78 family)